MSIAVERFLEGVEPGDVVNVDAFEDEHGPLLLRVLLDELEGRGFVLDSRNVLGEISFCTWCDGEGEFKGKCCSVCEGFCMTIDAGKGLKAYKQ